MAERRFTISYPSLDARIHATLRDDVNPEICQIFWEHLPYQSIQSHPMSSGHGMYAPHKIAAVVRTHTEVLSEVAVGTMWMSTIDYKTTTIKYGLMTEPLPITPIARIDDDDLKELGRVGQAVYWANFATHEPIPVHYDRDGDES